MSIAEMEGESLCSSRRRGAR